MSDGIDPGVGFELLVGPGDQVAVGDRLGVVHAADEDPLRYGEQRPDPPSARLGTSADRL